MCIVCWIALIAIVAPVVYIVIRQLIDPPRSVL